MNAELFKKKIVKHIDSGGGVYAVAKRLGLSKQFISQVYNGKKSPSETILNDMGYEKKITYEAKKLT